MIDDRYIQLAKSISEQISQDEYHWYALEHELKELQSNYSSILDPVERSEYRNRIKEIKSYLEMSRRESRQKVDDLLRNIAQSHPHLGIDQIKAELKKHI